MSDRDHILVRIREALRIAAPRRYLGHHGDADEHDPRHYRDYLPYGGKSTDERIGLFAKQAEALKAVFIPCTSEGEVIEKLSKLAAEEKWGSVAFHAATTSFASKLNLPTLDVEQKFDPKDLAKCDVGITACEALIAQSGSVLITSLSSGGRALSVLPPHHVVVAKRDQMVGDMADGFALLRSKYGDNIPAYVSFITGPSRTGDIERILVLGAHGPKKLTIFLY